MYVTGIKVVGCFIQGNIYEKKSEGINIPQKDVWFKKCSVKAAGLCTKA